MAHKQHTKKKHVKISDPEEDRQCFIVLGVTSSNAALAFGNGYGKPFSREDQAERRLKKLDDCYPELQFLTLEIKATKMAGIEEFE